MKDILLYDDSQKDEFIEIFKTPPIPLIEVKKILERQASDYILANTSPWMDCFYMDKLLYERSHLSAPRRGEPEVLKPPEAKDGTLPGNFGGNTVSRIARAHGPRNAPHLHARRGDVLQPFFYRRTSRRGDGRMTSSMGTGKRAPLRPWRTKGKLKQTRHIRRAQS